MDRSLTDRIRDRLKATGQTPNAASLAAGLDRDYIGDLLKDAENGEFRSPRYATIVKLAKALRCTPTWLANGGGLSGDAQEIAAMFYELPDEQQEAIRETIRTLHDRLKSKKAS